MKFRQRRFGRLDLSVASVEMAMSALSIGIARTEQYPGIHVWMQLGRTMRTFSVGVIPTRISRVNVGEKDPFFYWGGGGNA